MLYRAHAQDPYLQYVYGSSEYWLKGQISLLVNDFSVSRASARTVWGYPVDGVIAEGQSLLTVPDNIVAFTGGRLLADNSWADTDADGAALDPVVSVADAGTNKVICREANPTDTSNITKSGDAAATFTVIDDSASLAAANLDQVCTTGNVYKLDNSAGSTNAQVDITGQVATLNPQTITMRCRSSGSIQVYFSDGSGYATSAVTPSGTYSLFENSNITPADTTTQVRIRACAGAVVYFILLQLEENTVATPISYNDLLSSATRDADDVTVPMPSILSGASGAIEFTVTPNKTGQTAKFALGSTVDASNLFAVEMNATTIDLIKKVANTDYSAQEAYTHAKDTKARIQIYGGSAGTGIRAADASADITALSFHTNANALDMPFDTDLEVGNQGGVNLFVGDYPVDDFKFYTSKDVAGWS